MNPKRLKLFDSKILIRKDGREQEKIFCSFYTFKICCLFIIVFKGTSNIVFRV